MSGRLVRGFSPCSPDFRYSRRSARFRRPSRRRSKGCRPASRNRRKRLRLLRRALPRLPRLRSASAPRRFPAFWAAVRRPPLRLRSALPRLRSLRSASVPIFSPAFWAAGRTGGHWSSPLFPPRSPVSLPDLPAPPLARPPASPPLRLPPRRRRRQSPEQGAPVAAPQPGLATTPDLVPPFLTPPYGFNNLPTLLPPSPGPVATPTSLPPSTALSPLLPAVLPTQAYDLRAPPIVVRSAVSVSGGYTDNPNNTPQKSPTAYARLGGSTVISVDTVRLQGQLSGGINYVNYARDTNQDSLNANLAAFGLGTVVQDHIFIDGRAAITQSHKTVDSASPDRSLSRDRSRRS